MMGRSQRELQPQFWCFFTRSSVVKHPEARMDPPTHHPNISIHTLEAPMINGEYLGSSANLPMLHLIKDAV